MSSLKIKKKLNQTKTWCFLTLFILVWFTHRKRRGEIQTGENNVHQGLSKVFVFYTYSSNYFKCLNIPHSSCTRCDWQFWLLDKILLLVGANQVNRQTDQWTKYVLRMLVLDRTSILLSKFFWPSDQGREFEKFWDH